MYQAIVFLPLLGAILAGLIALAGARARHPGGAAMPAHAGHGAADHEGPGAQGAQAAHDNVAHDDAAHGDAAHGGHAVEPAAAGSRPAELITTVFLFISMILSWIAFATVGFGQDERVQIFNWMTVGNVSVVWAGRGASVTALRLAA